MHTSIFLGNVKRNIDNFSLTKEEREKFLEEIEKCILFNEELDRKSWSYKRSSMLYQDLNDQLTMKFPRWVFSPPSKDRKKQERPKIQKFESIFGCNVVEIEMENEYLAIKEVRGEPLLQRFPKKIYGQCSEKVGKIPQNISQDPSNEGTSKV